MDSFHCLNSFSIRKLLCCHKWKILVLAKLDIWFGQPQNSIPMTKKYSRKDWCLKCLLILFCKLDFLILLESDFLNLGNNSAVPRYVASVSPIKLSKPKKPRKIRWSHQKIILTSISMGKRKSEGVFFSRQNHKVFDDISKSEEDHQGCIIKKVKLNDGNNNFLLTDYTTISKSKLAY